jgi:hypothetical protein
MSFDYDSCLAPGKFIPSLKESPPHHHHRHHHYYPSFSTIEIDPLQITMKTEEEETYKGLGDPTLLEKIDKLFACNVGEHVNLPQLVVVGDQSSGKSSVLEGLMKLPFPRDSGLCTRFATQIIFRRSSKQNILVSIIPDANATPEHAEKVRAWSTTDLKTLDASSFARIMDEVRPMYAKE